MGLLHRDKGATFPVVLPTGEFAELVPGRFIQCHGGMQIPLPIREDGRRFDLLFLAITNVGGFRIAGQAQAEPHEAHAGTWVHGRGGWVHVSTNAPGVYPVIFDAEGELLIATPERNGSQGWRYIDERGDAVTGDDTLDESRVVAAILNLKKIWHYSYLGGVVFGQGETGFDVITPDKVRRRLEDGDTQHGRITYDARLNRWGIGISKLREGEAARGVVTLEQLLALPVVDDTVPVPSTPEPQPPQPEEPKPMTMMMPPDVHATYVAVVRKFPHDGDEHDRRAAQRKAIETLRARHGDRWVWKTQHATGYEAASKDAIGYVPVSEGPIRHGEQQRMYVWDAINGTTREPNPAGPSEELSLRYVLAPEPKDWLAGDVEQPEKPVDPTKPHVYDGGDNDTGICDLCDQPKDAAIHTTVSVPPKPKPGDDEIAELRSRVEHLEASLRGLYDAHHAHDRRIERLENAPTPTVSGKVRIKGRTEEGGGRFLGHSHAIDIEGEIIK